MKKEKMSIDKMKNVLSHVLSREEMKEVMAGSSGGCGYCKESGAEWGYPCATPGYNSQCQCYSSGIPNCGY
jgi:hypothetical protein